MPSAQDTPCPECGSLNRVHVQKDADIVCTNCGLVLDTVLDDLMDYKMRSEYDHPREDDGHVTLTDDQAVGGVSKIGYTRRGIIFGMGTSLEATLQRTQAQVTSAHQRHEASWRNEMRNALTSRLESLMCGTGKVWCDNAWAMFVVVADTARMQERLRTAMLAVVAYYAMFLTTTRKFCGRDMQDMFAVDQVSYDDAKKIASVVLRAHPRYQSCVTKDVDNPVEELRRCVTDIVAISRDQKRLVHHLACEIDSARQARNVLGGSKPMMLRPAIIQLTCEALAIDVTIEAILEQCGAERCSLGTVKSNTAAIKTKVLAKWSENGGWLAHVVMARKRERDLCNAIRGHATIATIGLLQVQPIQKPTKQTKRQPMSALPAIVQSPMKTPQQKVKRARPCVA